MGKGFSNLQLFCVFDECYYSFLQQNFFHWSVLTDVNVFSQNFKYENLTWILFRKMKFLHLFREFLVWWKIFYENYDDSLVIFGQFLSCSTFLHTHILCSKLSIFLDFGYDLWTNKTILKVHKRSLTNFKYYFIGAHIRIK